MALEYNSKSIKATTGYRPCEHRLILLNPGDEKQVLPLVLGQKEGLVASHSWQCVWALGALCRSERASTLSALRPLLRESVVSKHLTGKCGAFVQMIFCETNPRGAAVGEWRASQFTAASQSGTENHRENSGSMSACKQHFWILWCNSTSGTSGGIRTFWGCQVVREWIIDLGTRKLRRNSMQEVVSAKPGRRAYKNAALGTTSLVDGIRSRDDGGVVDLSTHICFLGVFAWGIKGKIPIINSAWNCTMLVICESGMYNPSIWSEMCSYPVIN